MSRREWRSTPSGWWRAPGAATYSRWRRARQPYLCSEGDNVIGIGARYVESVAAPWHDVMGQVWRHARFCDRHPDWAPPA